MITRRTVRMAMLGAAAAWLGAWPVIPLPLRSGTRTSVTGGLVGEEGTR